MWYCRMPSNWSCLVCSSTFYYIYYLLCFCCWFQIFKEKWFYKRIHNFVLCSTVPKLDFEFGLQIHQMWICCMVHASRYSSCYCDCRVTSSRVSASVVISTRPHRMLHCRSVYCDCVTFTPETNRQYKLDAVFLPKMVLPLWKGLYSIRCVSAGLLCKLFEVRYSGNTTVRTQVSRVALQRGEDAFDVLENERQKGVGWPSSKTTPRRFNR